MKLELGIMAGPESKAFLVDFTKQIDRLEKLVGLAASSGRPKTEEEDDEDVEVLETESADEDEDEDFASAKKQSKAKAPTGFDEDEEEEQESDEAEEDEEEEKPKAKAKAKKVTVDDVNDACKAKAKSIGGKAGREKVLSLLKKNFKTESVSELKPEQYAKCIELMAV